MVSIDDLQEVPHGLFKEPIIEPLAFKIADIRHLENHEIVISQRKVYSVLMKFGTQQQIWNSMTAR